MRGNHIICSAYAETAGKSFRAVNPATGQELAGDFYKAQILDVENALKGATLAYQSYRELHKDLRAGFLRNIADEIFALGDQLINRASAESGLPEARLRGELGRTTGQLRLFADQIAEGSWVDAIIDTAQPDRQPLPRPDIRRMLVPLGPVVVFGASNFPLAFSVAGGDTASALAAGCPVIVKAHPAHLGTSALVGAAIVKAIEKSGVPKGVFSLLFDDGYTVGEQLVKHPYTKAVTFTGSFKGGSALISLAQERAEPIPVFAEMGSINPVILLPQAIANKPEELAQQCAASIALGAGQFCTNPGLLIAVNSPGLEKFKATLADKIRETPSATMLSPGIYANYNSRSAVMLKWDGVDLVAESRQLNDQLQNQSVARLVEVSATDFLSNKELHEEVFGPHSILVIAENMTELEDVIHSVNGQLTISLMAAPGELENYSALLNDLTGKTGRLILNGMPTGVEVCSAMQHGGPYPSTNDSRFTSVGTTAIHRFVRPVAWQDWEDALLPDALKAKNPLGIYRMVDQKLTNHGQ